MRKIDSDSYNNTKIEKKQNTQCTCIYVETLNGGNYGRTDLPLYKRKYKNGYNPSIMLRG